MSEIPEDKNSRTGLFGTEETTTPIPTEEPPSIVDDTIPLQRWSKEWFWEIRGSLPVILTTITLAIFTDIFVYAIIVPVVPFAFVERLGVSTDSVQSQVAKALAVYSVGVIVGSAVFGYISDKIKRRQELMVGGLLIIIGSTLILCLTKVLWLYFVGRLVQGISAGVVWTVGLAIIADTGTSDNMAFLMSFPGIGTALGTFLGPLIGGVTYQRAGYYPVFYICFGILAVDVVLRLFMLEKSQLYEKRHKRALELSTKETDSLSPELVTYMNRYVDFHDDTEEIELKQKELQEEFGSRVTIFGKVYRIPMIISILKDVRVANAILLAIGLAWIMSSVDTTVPLHLEDIFGFDSLQSGLVFLALAVPTVCEPIIGKLSDKYGPKYFISGGFMLMVPFLILLRVPTEDKAGHIALFVVLLGFIGFALMVVASPGMAEMSRAVTSLEAKHPGIYGKSKGFGQAYGLFNVGFSIGGLIGPFHSGETRDHAGWKTMVLSLAIVCILMSLISLVFAGDNIIVKYFQQKSKEYDDKADPASADV